MEALSFDRISNKINGKPLIIIGFYDQTFEQKLLEGWRIRCVFLANCESFAYWNDSVFVVEDSLWDTQRTWFEILFEDTSSKSNWVFGAAVVKLLMDNRDNTYPWNGFPVRSLSLMGKKIYLHGREDIRLRFSSLCTEYNAHVILEYDKGENTGILVLPGGCKINATLINILALRKYPAMEYEWLDKIKDVLGQAYPEKPFQNFILISTCQLPVEQNIILRQCGGTFKEKSTEGAVIIGKHSEKRVYTNSEILNHRCNGSIVVDVGWIKDCIAKGYIVPLKSAEIKFYLDNFTKMICWHGFRFSTTMNCSASREALTRIITSLDGQVMSTDMALDADVIVADAVSRLTIKHPSKARVRTKYCLIEFYESLEIHRQCAYHHFPIFLEDFDVNASLMGKVFTIDKHISPLKTEYIRDVVLAFNGMISENNLGVIISDTCTNEDNTTTISSLLDTLRKGKGHAVNGYLVLENSSVDCYPLLQTDYASILHNEICRYLQSKLILQVTSMQAVNQAIKDSGNIEKNQLVGYISSFASRTRQDFIRIFTGTSLNDKVRASLFDFFEKFANVPLCRRQLSTGDLAVIYYFWNSLNKSTQVAFEVSSTYIKISTQPIGFIQNRPMGLPTMPSAAIHCHMEEGHCETCKNISCSSYVGQTDDSNLCRISHIEKDVFEIAICDNGSTQTSTLIYNKDTWKDDLVYVHRQLTGMHPFYTICVECKNKNNSELAVRVAFESEKIRVQCKLCNGMIQE